MPCSVYVFVCMFEEQYAGDYLQAIQVGVLRAYVNIE